MAPQKFEAKLLKIVPKYDGNTSELSAFLDITNALIATYWDSNPENLNCVQNITLIYGIYAKLCGPAREVYTTCISKDWKSVKDALIAHFGDQRDENGLLFDLDQLRQKDNESSLQFYTKVMSNLCALHNYVGIHEDVEGTKIVKKEFYNTHALKIFLAGLKEPLGSTIRAMKPSTLAEARQFIISENNIRHLQKPNLDRNRIQIPKQHLNINSPRQQRHFYPPQQRHNNYSQFPQFPSNPIHFQPRPIQVPQRFFTNQQVFNNDRPKFNSSNVWKPQNSVNRPIQPKPVPMSGISHGTFPKPDSRTFRTQNQQRQPKFMSEELFNVEQPTLTEYDDSNNFTYENYETVDADPYSQNQNYQYTENNSDNIRESSLKYNQNFHEASLTSNPT